MAFLKESEQGFHHGPQSPERVKHKGKEASGHLGSDPCALLSGPGTLAGSPGLSPSASANGEHKWMFTMVLSV